VHQIEHPAVVGRADAEITSVAANEDAYGVGGDQRHDRVERTPRGRGGGERETRASSGQPWNAASDSGVDLRNHIGWRASSGECAPEERVQVLAQAPDTKEVILSRRRLHIEPDPREPVPQMLNRGQPLDRLSEATCDGRH